MPLDAIDRRIIAELQADGSLANVELARRVHLSPSPCLARVRALERAGVIRRYVALVDPEALGLGVTVFISISLREQNTATLAEFERRIGACDEVMECYLMTGDADYLLKSWHPTTRPRSLQLDPDLRWYRLDIIGRSKGALLATEGTVEFSQ